MFDKCWSSEFFLHRQGPGNDVEYLYISVCTHVTELFLCKYLLVLKCHMIDLETTFKNVHGDHI